MLALAACGSGASKTPGSTVSGATTPKSTGTGNQTAGPTASSQDSTAVSAGGAHTCALTPAGGLKCWGVNSLGQLGNGTTTESSTPLDVSGLTSGIAAVSAGYDHTCALTTTGGVKCWGVNVEGELGDGGACGQNCTTPIDVPGLASGAAAVSAGNEQTCVLTTGGGVKCWGANDVGELGDGTTKWSTTPVDVSGLTSGVAAVSVGYDHTCALTTAGGVKCWGANDYGQLGDGTSTGPQVCSGSACSTAPVDVSGLTSGAIAVSAGEEYTCALTTAGGVKCWGWNVAGQLGTTSSETCLSYPCATKPLGVSGLASGVAAVSADTDHTCALTTTGGVKCWGHNGGGQLGNGTTTGPELCNSGPCSTMPADVSGLASGVAAISTAEGHTCALITSGGVKCWGLNSLGQLGNGASSGPETCGAAPVTRACSTTPVDVVGLLPDGR